MRSVTCLLVCFFLFRLNSTAQESYTISDNSFDNLNFNEFVSKAEKLLQVRFFYDEAVIKDVKTTGYGCRTLQCALGNLFQGTGLYYLIEDSGNIIITSGYSINVPGKAGNTDMNLIVPGMYGGEESGNTSLNSIIEIGNPAERGLKGSATISGYIRNSETNEPVQGVTVFVRKLSAGTLSNSFGYYNLTLPRGMHLVQFTFIGMKENRVSLVLNGSGTLDMIMKNVLIPLKEAVVTADKNLTLQRFETGAEKIKVTDLKLLPTSLGEADVMKSALLVPGVLSVGEGSAGFNVRGGAADQNLILLYGAPVYNSTHFFGFFSAVNSDVIKDVTLYKGGIPARYGGRASSVFDIGTREGNRKEFAGNAGISPVAAHILVEGPIVKDTVTYLFSARTTYSNWVLDLIDNPSARGSRAGFNDFTGKIAYDIDRNNKIDFSVYASNDRFRFHNDTVYGYNNLVQAVRWRHFFGPTFLSSISLNSSTYKYDVSSASVAAEAFSLSHSINSTGFKADFNIFSGKNEFNYGTELTRYSVLPGLLSPANDSSMVVQQNPGRERAWEGAIYFEDGLTLSDLLSVNLGIRFSSFLVAGPSAVRLYNEGYSKSPSTIYDTLYYNAGKIIKNYGGPEIRFAANFRIDENKSLKLNYNKTRQYLHLLTNSASVSPTDIWKLSDYYIKPQSADQVSAGYYQVLSGRNIEISTEIFFKRLKNMIDFKGGTNLIMNESVEKDVINMNGKAYGLELSLRKPEGKIRYSLGYTYSRIFVHSQANFKDEILNGGRWFPANHDRPHDLILTFSYIFSRRLSFSAGYKGSSGRPVTYPLTAYRMYDYLLLHYSDRNKYRLPAYSRLDFSLMVKGNLRSKKLANPYLNFSVYNVLGRKNIYSVFFRDDGNVFRGYSLSVFGTPVPSVMFGFDF